MKRCPSCQRTYEDDAQAFCISDGTPLVSATAPSSLNQPLKPPSPLSPGAQPGRWTPPSGTPGSSWSPPGVGAPRRKRSVLPWILAGVAVLLVGFVAIAGVAAFFLLRSSSKNRNRININSSQTPQGNSTTGNVPTDKQEVLKQMYDLEYAWCAAGLKADKVAMDSILATEFVATRTDGTTQNKQEYVASLEPDQYQRTCSYSDFSLGQSANYAVIIGYNRISGRDANGPYSERYKFTDTFVWRDGRWQATASKSTKVK